MSSGDPSPRDAEGSQPNASDDAATIGGSEHDAAQDAAPTVGSEPAPREPAPTTETETVESSSDTPASGGAETPPPKAKWLNRARLARLVALVGVLVVVLAGKSLLFPHIPTTREVDLRLESPREVIGLDMRWAPAGTTEDIATTSLHFPPGAAPSSVITSVHLPDGAYDVEIVVMRASAVDSTRRRITLDGASRVTIPLR